MQSRFPHDRRDGNISPLPPPRLAMQSFLLAAAARSDALIPTRREDRTGVEPMPLSPCAPARPLRHVVAFKCAQLTPERENRLGYALSTLPALISELGAFHYGADMGLRSPGYNVDYAITADFADQASYLAFCRHPAYLKVVNEVIKPLLAPGEHIARIQFKIDLTSRSRQTLMHADPPLFNIRFGKSARPDPASPSSVRDV